MRVASKSALLLAITLPLLTSCRALVSETQRRDNSSAPSSTMIDGTQLMLASEITRNDTSKHQFDLTGKLIVTTTTGQIPDTVDLYHFSLRAAKAGYYVQNFGRRQDGSWRYAGRTSTGMSPNFYADVQRGTNTIVLNFEWKEIGGGLLDKPSSYDRVDVSVSLKDAAGKRHNLANLAVPTVR